LAVIYALRKLRKRLLGNDFLLYTDNEIASEIQTTKMVMAVQEVPFQVKHVAGKSNVVADVLSRYSIQEEQDNDNYDPLEDFYPVWLVSDVEPLYESTLGLMVNHLIHRNYQAPQAIKTKSLKL
jgi:hypothetical protein